MADNIPVTPGTGAIIAADEVAGALYQRVKLGIGGDGAAVDLAFGAQPVVSSLPVTMATNQPAIAVDQKSNALGSSATFTRGANVTPYAAGDLIGQVQTLASIGVALAAVMITGARLEIDVAAVPSGMTGLRLHLFTSAPSVTQSDNDAFNLIAADRAKYVGYIEFGTPLDLGDTLYGEINNLNKQLKMVTTDLFAVLTTNGGFTPAANSEVYKVTLHTVAV